MIADVNKLKDKNLIANDIVILTK